jgi:hypothetical protein
VEIFQQIYVTMGCNLSGCVPPTCCLWFLFVSWLSHCSMICIYCTFVCITRCLVFLSLYHCHLNFHHYVSLSFIVSLLHVLKRYNYLLRYSKRCIPQIIIVLHPFSFRFSFRYCLFIILAYPQNAPLSFFQLLCQL